MTSRLQAFVLSAICTCSLTFAQQGLKVSPPTFANAAITSTVVFKQATKEWEYQYRIANPGSNTVAVSFLVVDIASGVGIVSVETFGPVGWVLGNNASGKAALWGPGEGVNPMIPGSEMGGIGLHSSGPPCIRRSAVEPELEGYFNSLYAQGQVLSEDQQEHLEVQYRLVGMTLGPLGASPGTFAHWDTWQGDIAQAKQLGWISDATLATTIETNVAAARQAALAQDTPTARAKLQAVIDAIQGSQPSQRTSEGYALVFFNAQYLRDHLPTP